MNLRAQSWSSSINTDTLKAAGWNNATKLTHLNVTNCPFDCISKILNVNAFEEKVIGDD